MIHEAKTDAGNRHVGSSDKMSRLTDAWWTSTSRHRSRHISVTRSPDFAIAATMLNRARSSRSPPHARTDPRVQLLMTIPGVAEILGLTLASEIGEISRFPTAKQLVGYSKLSPTITQFGTNNRTGRTSKAGPRPAVLAGQQPFKTSLRRRITRHAPVPAAPPFVWPHQGPQTI